MERQSAPQHRCKWDSAPAQPVDEKTVSYVRKEFSATAETRNRLPLIAEAMVDAAVKIPGLIEKGKLLTLTTDEAMKHKVADFRAQTIESVLGQLDLAGAEVRRVSPNWASSSSGQRAAWSSLSFWRWWPVSPCCGSCLACLLGNA